MITPSDNGYKLTKLIKQGKATMNGEFKLIAEWIDKTYGVKTMNIIYDTIDNETRPRLNIIFEKHSDEEIFRSKFGFDQVKQKEIALQFKKTLIAQGLTKNKTIWSSFSLNDSDKYKTKNIWIIFSAFEPIAKIESYRSISTDEIQGLMLSLNMSDLWEIHNNTYDTATFFFYTDKQIEKYSKNGEKEILIEKYFELLKKYDEFDYLKKEEVSIQFDSKENFDNYYKGSWFNYDIR